MKYTRSKKILSLALTLLMLGGTVTSSFANVESLKNQNTKVNNNLNQNDISDLAYQLKDEFDKRPNESPEDIIKDIYNKNKTLVDTIQKKSSISEDELLDFVSKNPNSKAVVNTFKSRSKNSIKRFYKDTNKLGKFVKKYKSELKEYYDPDSLPEYTFTLNDGRVLSIQGAVIGIDDPVSNNELPINSRAYTPTRSHSRSYYSWANVKLFTIYVSGYFSYNGSSLPTGYPDAVNTYVKKGFLSLWQINEWSEGATKDPKGGYTKIYGAGSFYLGFDVGGGSLHFQTIKGEAGLKCDKKGSMWTYSYY